MDVKMREDYEYFNQIDIYFEHSRKEREKLSRNKSSQ